MRRALILILVVLTGCLIVAGFCLKELLNLPINSIELLSIPCYLFICQSLIIVYLPRYLKKHPNKLINYFSFTKVAKFLLSLVFIAVWYYVGGVNKIFMVTFLVYYIIFILFDSWMFMRCNKMHSIKSKK